MLYIISSIPLVLYLLALALGLLGVRMPGGSAELAPLAIWMLVVALGLSSLWAAFGHAFDAAQVARSIGWAPSPFQHEIAGANLGLGRAAIAAARLGRGAGWAVFIAAASFLWSAAGVHIASMVESGNFAVNNAGPIFWTDILLPLTLLIALVRSRAQASAAAL